MRFFRLLIPLAMVLLMGCMTVSEQKTTTAADFPRKWVPAVSLHDAQSLTPDEAKAVVIARAAVEEMNHDASEPPGILRLVPQKEGDGWTVHITFVGSYESDGAPGGGPGYFCVVQLDQNWKVTAIVNGQ